MSPDEVVSFFSNALWVAVLIGAPVLGAGLIIGLGVGVFQAATQIQEATLGFLPKAAAMVAVMVWGGPWFLDTLTGFIREVFVHITHLGPGMS